MTLFAFNKGQALSEYTAPFDAMVHILEGKTEVIISNKAYIVGVGEMIVLPANKPHALSAIENFKMLLTMIRS